MTSEEFDAGCNELCPHCKGGNPARQRTDTLEWCHDFVRELGPGGKSFSHVICQAHEFRTANGKS